MQRFYLFLTLYIIHLLSVAEWFDTWPDIQSLSLIYIVLLYLVYLKSLTPFKFS